MLRKTNKSKQARDEFNDELSKHPDLVHDMIRQFIDQTTIQYATVNVEERTKLLLERITTNINKIFPDDNVTVTSLGGVNNLNLLINYKNQDFVVQIGARREPVDHALASLNPSSKTSFLAKISGTHRITSGSTILEEMAFSSTTPVGFLSVMEKLDSSLQNEVKLAKQTERKVKIESTKGDEFAEASQKQIDLAVTIGQQSAALFASMSKKGIVWSDYKPGNLLLRKTDGDVKLAIADTKAILPVSELPMKNGRSGQIDLDSLITQSFLSNAGFQAVMSQPNPAEFKAIIEKEYSYQMAVAMYYAMTGISVVNRDDRQQLSAGESKTFDFGPDELKSPQAKRMQFIIEKLGDPEPDQRMSYADANALLAVLDNEKKFNTAVNKVKSISLQSPSSSPVMSGRTSTIMTHLSGGDRNNAKQTLKQKSELRRVTSGGSLRLKQPERSEASSTTSLSKASGKTVRIQLPEKEEIEASNAPKNRR